MKDQIIKILFVIAVSLPLLALFFPFTEVRNEYFDEDANEFVFVSSTIRYGYQHLVTIFMNYCFMGLIIAVGFTGKSFNYFVALVFVLIVGFFAYENVVEFGLLFHWGTNDWHTTLLTGYYIMFSGTVLLSATAFLRSLGGLREITE